jgi:hypothetical protein
LKHYLFITGKPGQNIPKDDVRLKENCLIAGISDMFFKLAQFGNGNVTIAVINSLGNPNEAVSLENCS